MKDGQLLAAVASILIATIIGMIDDLLGWRTGIRQSKKVLLTFLIPVPLMVINAGQNTKGQKLPAWEFWIEKAASVAYRRREFNIYDVIINPVNPVNPV